jgi:hypothetical protein
MLNEMSKHMEVARDTQDTSSEDKRHQGDRVPAAKGRRARKPLISPPRAKSKFSWTMVNFWLDGTLLIVFLSLIWVTTIIRFIFPPASAAQGWMLWGYDVDAWMEWQFALTAVFSLGILVHLMLHWSWVCGVFFSRIWRRKKADAMPDDGTRTIYGVGLMIVLLNLLGLLIAAAVLGIQPPS